ncbi:MAG: NUDIX hydrolase [Cohaesibacter sp.]|jgi:ADP-ribose pyrophosphatase YjhB (NUDIX family)|nr:NUDIX hydrolase [Cohaesibacter sp.]
MAQPDHVREYPARPFLGVSAVIESDEGILLIERGKPPLAGLWSLPGGVVEVGETLEAAIAREIEEETGLSFVPSHLADLVEIIRPDASGKTERHYVIAVYYGKSGALPLVAGDDAASACWVGRADLSSYSMTQGTLEVIEKVLSQAPLFPT